MLVRVYIKALFSGEGNRYDADFAGVREQESVKQVIEAAAAVSHNLVILYMV